MKKQLNGPVYYIDPVTGEKKCEAKACRKKFTINKFYVKETNYKWVGGPVIHMFHYSLCNECGMLGATSKDKSLTSASYKRGTENKGVDPETIGMEVYEKDSQL
jgi:hypothetical protein